MYINIVNWYSRHKRDLAFRKYNDPYAVWVSEIMAQQTKIDTMLPYFDRWMTTLPTIEKCANASIEEILKLWEGLGYYRRARLLHEGCIYLKNNFNSIFPENYDEVIKIPGIGEYSAAAICSIVFNHSIPAIDGNVMRIVTRMQMIDQDISKLSTKKKVKEVVNDWISIETEKDMSSFTQGLMEIGALVCTPKNPKCESCPLNINCLSFKHNVQHDFPVKKKKPKSPIFNYSVLIIIENNQILVSNDWSDGLMKGLLRLPQVDSQALSNFYNVKMLDSFNHVFSHKVWSLDVYTCSLKSTHQVLINSNWYWLNLNEIDSQAWITAHKKIITSFVKV